MNREVMPLAALARISGPTERVISFVEPSTGLQWIVFEGRADRHDSADMSRCLFFVSEAAIRRVCRYPEGWAELSPAELLELSWQV